MRSTMHYRLPGSLPVLSVLLVGAVLLLPLTAAAQRSLMGGSEDKQIDAAAQAEIIDSVAAALNEIYVFPDVARSMEDHIRQQYKKGVYKELTGCRAFTEKLTEDLREISKDRHLWTRFAPDDLIEAYQGDTLTDDAKKRQELEDRRANFGFKSVRLLEGNIGYIDLRGFHGARDAGPTAIAAMNFLANADAIIFDLRQNGGGQPSMIQLISSYLFDTVTHLNSFYIRKQDTTEQFYTHAWVPGPSLSHVDVYVLTSGYTFSAAEEFTYNLKNLKRATIIGETTGGGAHPVERTLFADLNVLMSVPFGRAVNPITGTNWEGTGITPHIEVPQEAALDVAHVEALKALIAREQDAKRKEELKWLLDYKETLRKPFAVQPAVLMDYVGTYGPRVITFEGGELYYQREDNPRYHLVPMAKDLFAVEELDYFRVEFVRDESGKVEKLVGLYAGGHTDSHERGN